MATIIVIGKDINFKETFPQFHCRAASICAACEWKRSLTVSLPPLSSSLIFSRASTERFRSLCRRRPKSLNMVEPPDRTTFCGRKEMRVTQLQNEKHLPSGPAAGYWPAVWDSTHCWAVWGEWNGLNSVMGDITWWTQWQSITLTPFYISVSTQPLN